MKQATRLERCLASTILAACVVGLRPAARAAPADLLLYRNDFEKSAVGSVPDDFLVLNGNFSVKAEAGNKFLELPGAPLDSFGALFGPTAKGGVAVSARIRSTAHKRRYPAFGIGLDGAGGYRLQIAPAKHEIEIYQGDILEAKAPYQWAAGQWAEMRLQVRKRKRGGWQADGKAWAQGSLEPNGWMIAFRFAEEPPAGRAAIWGQPYAGTPIQYDDLAVTTVVDHP